jgi:hypothetical protein
MPGLDITLFNDKWEFKFCNELAEALMLFIGEYGQEAMRSGADVQLACRGVPCGAGGLG